MQIADAELYHHLGRRHRLVLVRAPQKDAVLSHVRIWRGQRTDPGVLYLTEETLSRKAMLLSADAVVVCAGKDDMVPAAALSRGNGMVLVCADGTSAEQMLEEIADALLALESWDNDLKDALFSAASLDRLCEVGHRMIPELLSMVDPDLNILAMPRAVLKDSRQEGMIMQDITGPLRLANPAVESLLLMDDYPHAADQKEAFLYPTDPAEALYLCGNVFAGEENCARLVSELPIGMDAFSLQGFTALFEHLLRYIRQAFLRDWRDERELNLNDDLHRALRMLLDAPEQIQPASLVDAVASYGWEPTDIYLVMRARFIEGAYWEGMANYICSQIEQIVAASVAAANGGEIIWICNLSRAGDVDETALSEKLAYIVRDYTCKVGLSRRLQGIEQIATGSLEARIALEVGQSKDPFTWYYRFDDYAPDYLLARMTGELPASQLVHPGFARLEEYDQMHGTDLLASLRLYFDCGFNVTDAAEQAFVHRTTFSRRVERIEEVGGLDLRDPATRRYLTLSFWMLTVAAGEESAKG